jgi:hypothetical protein
LYRKTVCYIFFSNSSLYSYITRDELEAALLEHEMGDATAIKDIISEVDTDNVRLKITPPPTTNPPKNYLYQCSLDMYITVIAMTSTK